jgi:hypothetical protein
VITFAAGHTGAHASYHHLRKGPCSSSSLAAAGCVFKLRLLGDAQHINQRHTAARPQLPLPRQLQYSHSITPCGGPLPNPKPELQPKTLNQTTSVALNRASPAPAKVVDEQPQHTPSVSSPCSTPNVRYTLEP